MKRKLIIADPDIDYAIKLLEQFSLKYRDVLDIHVITDPDYFYDYFSQPQRVDILVASQDFNLPNQSSHMIDQLFWLCESQNVDIPDNDSIVYLYKYSSLHNLMSRLCSDLRQPEGSGDTDPKLIVVTSASGGTGKTTIATALASMQKLLQRKVLYLNVANIQNFSHLFHEKGEIPLAVESGLADQITFSPYNTLSRYFRTDGCDYLPAFDSALSEHGIPLSFFADFVDKAVNNSDYDVLVADVACGDPTVQKEFLKRADHAVIVTDESRPGIQALKKLLPSLDQYKGMEVSLLLNKANINRSLMSTEDPNEQRKDSPFAFTIDFVNGLDRMTGSELARHPAFKRVINLCY